MIDRSFTHRALVVSGSGVPDHLAFDEVRSLITACNSAWNDPARCTRNRLLLEVLWQTGLRIGEVVGGPRLAGGVRDGWYSGIRPVDINPRNLSIRVQVEKRSRPYFHDVYIEPGVLAELLAYHHAAGIQGTARLFPISKRTVQHVIKQAASAAGIVRRVTPHMLRHSYAMYLRRNGVHPFDMQQALGHSSIQSTLVYGRATDADVAADHARIRFS